MENSIGSLAALAAIVTPALAAPLPDPVAADFANVPVSIVDNTHIDFDIDGDETADFYVYGNFGDGLVIEGYGATQFSTGLSDGSLFFTSSATQNWAMIGADTTSYVGFSFVTGGLTHAAWVLFDASSVSPTVVGGGWQMMDEAPVLVGSPSPIPEPSAFAALAGAGALSGALVRRRRRASA